MALTPAFGTIKPSQKQQLLSDNYLSFNGGANPGDSDTFMVGAEMPMTSDQVIWSEQNRLHVAYNDVSNDGTNTLTFTVGGVGDAFVENVISKDQTIVILDTANSLELKALVLESSQAGVTATVEVAPYTAADTSSLSLTGLKIFVYGSEYGKGKAITNSTGIADTDGYKTITPSFTQYSNSPIIIRNKYVVNGSDMAQIGWVEVATEDGTSGYLWYYSSTF